MLPHSLVVLGFREGGREKGRAGAREREGELTLSFINPLFIFLPIFCNQLWHSMPSGVASILSTHIIGTRHLRDYDFQDQYLLFFQRSCLPKIILLLVNWQPTDC